MEQNKALTLDVVKTTMQVTLQKAQLGIQNLHDAEAKLVFNEDNLGEIESFLALVKKGRKLLDEQHKEIKRPILEQQQAIDGARNAIGSQLDGIYQTVYAKYTKLIKEMQERMKRDREEAERKAQITKGIDQNIIYFASEIGAATDLNKLIEVERLINLEKTKKGKYGEYLPELISRLEGLNQKLTEQKEKLRLLAKTKDDEEAARLRSSIEEGKINVQEEALNAVVSQETPVEVVHVATPRPKRTVWKYRVNDIERLLKTHPHLVMLVPNAEEIEKLLPEAKEMAKKGELDEVTLNGVYFYAEKYY